MTDHDQFLKKLLMTFFPDLLQIVVPHLAPKLQANQATFLMQENFSALVEEGHRAIVDLVAKIPTIGGLHPLVLVHVEVEGRHSGIMSERMLRYYMHLRLTHHLLVIPIVLNLRGGPAGITKKTVIDEVEGEVINTFHYFVLGLEKCVAEDFLARSESLGWGLAAFMRPRSDDRVDQKYRCLDAVARGQLDEKREQMLLNLIETYLPLEGAERRRYNEMVANQGSEAVKAMEMTWAGKIEAKGRTEGMRNLLLRQAERRFGPLPEEMQKHLLALRDPDELNRLSDRLLEARSLEELGLMA